MHAFYNGFLALDSRHTNVYECINSYIIDVCTHAPLVECVELYMIHSKMDTARFSYCVLCVLQKPLRFLANYKNPCWHETVQRGNTNKTVLRCLPYYMIAGQTKCGTTDLYFALIEHPSIERCIVKEPQWWAVKRFSK